LHLHLRLRLSLRLRLRLRLRPLVLILLYDLRIVGLRWVGQLRVRLITLEPCVFGTLYSGRGPGAQNQVENRLDQHAIQSHRHTWRVILRYFPKSHLCDSLHGSDRLVVVSSTLESYEPRVLVCLISICGPRIFPSESLMQPFMRPNSFYCPQRW
jgi:hypothetical protein